MPLPESTASWPRAVAIGCSAGGMAALDRLFVQLPAGFRLPVVVVQHLHPHDDGFLVRYLAGRCSLPVKEAQDKEPVLPGTIYFAPPGYHLLLELDLTLALSVDEKVSFSRPSIDVLFESAARAWGRGLVGVLLTGANQDGTQGLKMIRSRGGLTVAQDPGEAEYSAMPGAALAAGVVDQVLTLDGIAALLGSIHRSFDPSPALSPAPGRAR